MKLLAACRFMFWLFLNSLSTTNDLLHNYPRKITSALDFQSEPWYNNHVSNRIAKAITVYQSYQSVRGYASGTFLLSVSQPYGFKAHIESFLFVCFFI